jgi:NADH-quinone oxidoreductase subunit J
MSELVYFFFVLLSVAGALLVLTARRVMYAGLGLMLALIGLAGLYALHNAPFLALTQILVYVGGILILILFAIMFTRRKNSLSPKKSWLGIFAGLSMAALLAYALLPAILPFQHTVPQAATASELSLNSTQEIGIQLLTTYLLPFELTAILLLVVLVGAVWLASRAQEVEK